MSFGSTNYNSLPNHPNSLEHQNYYPQNGQNVLNCNQTMNWPSTYGDSYNNHYAYNNYNPNQILQSNNLQFNQYTTPKSCNRNEIRKKKPLDIFDPSNNQKLDIGVLARVSENQNTSNRSSISSQNNTSLLSIIPTQQPTITSLVKPKSLLEITDPTTKSTSVISNCNDNSDISTSSSYNCLNGTIDNNNNINNSDNNKLRYLREDLIKIGQKSSTQDVSYPFLSDSEFKDIVNTDNSKPALTTVTKYQPKKTKRVDIMDPVTCLRRSTKGYKPPYLRIKDRYSEDTKLKTFCRSFTIILNKIAPQNFNDCFTEILSLIKISSTDNELEDKHLISCLIEEIFNKAVKQESYSVTYANLCKELSKLDNDKSFNWNFKHCLLNRCKEMFETPLQELLDHERNYWEEKRESETDKTLRNIYSEDMDELLKKAKDRYFGNVRFIGELYVKDLLKPTIVYNCIKNLLAKTNEPEALLSMCKLLVTTGKVFDQNHPDKMNEIFNSINELLDKSEIFSNTKVRFALMDVMEMRERNWTLREIQQQKIIQPKTLAEVKQDVAAAAALISSIAINNSPSSSNLAATNSPRSYQKSNIKSNHLKTSSSTSELKTKSTIQNRDPMIDPSTLSHSGITNDGQLSLKPMSDWASGSGSNNSWQSVDTIKKRNSNYNRSSKKVRGDINLQKSIKPSNSLIFSDNKDSSYSSGLSNLANGIDAMSPVRSREESPGSVGGLSLDTPYPINKPMSKIVVSESKYSALIDHLSDDGDEQVHDNDSPNNSTNALVNTNSSAENFLSTSVDLLIMNHNDLLNDAIHNHRLHENSWCALVQPDLFITDLLDSIMDTDEKTRRLIGLEFRKLLNNNQLTLDIFIEGLSNFDKVVDDLITDIPNLWLFLGEVLQGLADTTDQLNTLNLTDIQSIFQRVFLNRLITNSSINQSIGVLQCAIISIKPVVERFDAYSAISTKYIDWMRSIINTSATYIGMTTHQIFGRLHTNSQLVCVLDKLNVMDLLDINVNELQEQLLQLLPRNDEEAIHTLLEKKFNQDQMQTAPFISIVFRTIFQYISNLCVASIENFLKSTLMLCQRYVDHKPILENQVLITLTDFATDFHDTEKLEIIISWLLVNQIISIDAFQQYNDTFINNCNNDHNSSPHSTNYQLIISVCKTVCDQSVQQ